MNGDFMQRFNYARNLKITMVGTNIMRDISKRPNMCRFIYLFIYLIDCGIALKKDPLTPGSEA